MSVEAVGQIQREFQPRGRAPARVAMHQDGLEAHVILPIVAIERTTAADADGHAKFAAARAGAAFPHGGPARYARAG